MTDSTVRTVINFYYMYTILLQLCLGRCLTRFNVRMCVIIEKKEKTLVALLFEEKKQTSYYFRNIIKKKLTT